MITTKQQRTRLYNCHAGVGFLAYKQADETIVQTEFYIRNGIPCYLATGEPIEFHVSVEEEV